MIVKRRDKNSTYFSFPEAWSKERLRAFVGLYVVVV